MIAHAHLAFPAAGPPPDPGPTDDGEADDLATQGAGPAGTITSVDADRDEPGELVSLTVKEICRLHSDLRQPRH